MPEDVANVKVTTDEKQMLKKPEEWYRHEQWIYGYHLKNKHFRRISQKYGLPWQKRPLSTMERVISHIRASARGKFRLRPVAQANGSALILFFVESDGRKRMKDSIASVEDMDKVRKVLGLPKGRKPKWYNCYGCDDYDNAVDSSEDEARPVLRARGLPPPRYASEFDRTRDSCQDSGTSIASNNADEGDSDGTSSGGSQADDADSVE